ncbi:hypothetical protein LQE92_07070 [Lacrimispora sp. NSJ-141]|uniref:Uncharacterized protein n=1 Tax=Lientehia hominis TaxID=2897778 RepID=A0AAP2RJ88_9FIRM|nr:hypothetical protein [Lientehia hominis]MCD2492393.1 hypothetical protein [Lientehia hominis]
MKTHTKKKRWKAGFFFVLAGCLFLSGCGKKTEEPETTETMKPAGSEAVSPNSPEALRAMYLTSPDGQIYFVDIHNGTFFTAPIPEELYDASGNRLSSEDLSAGYILDIYGNGIMLESYPGQYPGVTKMAVVKEGTAKDAAVYQYLIDEIYTEPDPSQPASLNLEYRTEQAAAAVMLSRGNYSWSYTDKNGEKQQAVACGSHILEWEELVDVSLDSGTKLTLSGSPQPDSVMVTRWPVNLWKSGSADASSQEEAVETALEEGVFCIPSSDPGYVYLIEATWPEGTVEFGFFTK